MGKTFHEKTPLYLQIKEKIEDQIVNGQLKTDGQIPSTTQMVNFYKINHMTIIKGINLLVDEGLVYKRRGLGMFVAEGAREKLLQNRKRAFAENYIWPMIREAEKLGLSKKDIDDVLTEIEEGRGDDKS